MKKISGIIIAKNEEKMIEEALLSLSFCDQIIVVDNNSQDRTKEIAEKHKAEVYEIDSSDFANLRNYGLSKATGEYVLYLDADERITNQLGEEIKKIINGDNKYSAFKLLRKNFYFGNKEWPYIEKLERLFTKDKLKEWKGELHESPVFEGKLGELRGFMIHYTHRDLESMLSKTIEWSSKEALLRFNSGHPQMSWWRFPRVMLSSFANYYFGQGGFRAGAGGVLESVYQSFSTFVTYAKLWELQHNSNLKK